MRYIQLVPIMGITNKYTIISTYNIHLIMSTILMPNGVDKAWDLWYHLDMKATAKVRKVD